MRNVKLLARHAVLSLALSSVALMAQDAWKDPAALNAPPRLSAADQKWAELQALFGPPAPGSQVQAKDDESRARMRRQQAERFLRAADEAAAFVSAYPDSAKVSEARCQEAKSLLQAAMVGEVSREARAAQLLQEMRADQSLPAKARLELISLSEIVRIRPLAKNREAFLAEHERSARSLMLEFPGESGPYESLLRLAENNPVDREGIRIATDVVKSPAPARVKDAARMFLDKQALVGRSLPQIAAQALGAKSAFADAAGHGIVVYTWSSLSPGSIAAAKNLAKTLPGKAVLIGINFDQDTATAQATAQREGLAGPQLYDARAFDSPLAQALKLTRLGEVYVAGSDGKIASVSAQRGDLTAKLGSAAK